MKIGILGGSFNPVHNGHISLAKQLLELAGLDEVWFMVSPQNPLKRRSDIMDDDIRLRLVSLALRGEPRLRVCDREMTMPKPSYTMLTMRMLSREYPEHRFTLLIGGDNWLCFSQWRDYEDLLAEYDIAVYPRTGSEIDVNTLPPRVKLYDVSRIDISSTQIRQFIRQGRSIDGLVPPSVAAVISKEGLYL